MRAGRPRTATALTSLAAVAVVGLVPAAPSAAEPDVDDVQSRVDTLYRQAEKASERYNDARIDLKEMRGQLDHLRTVERRRARSLERARRNVEDAVVRQYEGDSVAGVSSVLVSEDPQSFVEQMATMDAYGQATQSVYDDFTRQAAAAERRSDHLAKRVHRLAEVEDGLARDKATVDDKLAEAKELLGRLEAREREQEVSRSSSSPGSPPSRRRAVPPPRCPTRGPRSGRPTPTAPPARAPSTARA